MATIKFRDSHWVEIRDNDGREVILHFDEVVKIVRDILSLIKDMVEIRDRLDGMFKRETK